MMVAKPIAAASLILSGILLFSPAQNNFRQLASEAYPNFRLLSQTSFEDRYLLAYGDTTGLGYGYIRQIVDSIPDPDFFPVIRYQNYSHHIHLVLPGHRHTTDGRILIGIDIPDQDIKKNIIANAQRINQTADKTISLWTFVTGYDYESLTGFYLRLQPHQDNVPHPLKISLIDSEGQKNLGEWTWDAANNQSEIYLELPQPLSGFSFNHGATPFLVKIKDLPGEGNPPLTFEEVNIEAVKIDLSSYTLLHHRGSSFTAVRTDFMDQIMRDGPEPWRQYLHSLKHD
ncbi:MAG: hypothetical protein HYZ84_02515 [Candidatus Omnitrophica bacterium]|nr:hypothetical protein [Candidatus Omnitrophota bacterium]